MLGVGDGGDGAAVGLEAAVGARSDPNVIVAPPDLQIVAAFGAGSGVVRYFIGGQPGRRQDLLCGLEQRHGVVVPGWAQFAPPPRAMKRRALLDGELVGRNVSIDQIERAPQLVAPRGRGLVRAGIDAVERMARAVPGSEFHRRDGFAA